MSETGTTSELSRKRFQIIDMLIERVQQTITFLVVCHFENVKKKLR